jgi:hypothetical protein
MYYRWMDVWTWNVDLDDLLDVDVDVVEDVIDYQLWMELFFVCYR